jgi:hypothetical protein
MRVRIALILTLLPTLALGADDLGVLTGGPFKPPPPAAAPAPAASPTPAAPPIASPTAAIADPGECRIGCADDRYACEASDHSGACAGTWSQCVATCDEPNLAPGFSTAP